MTYLCVSGKALQSYAVSDTGAVYCNKRTPLVGVRLDLFDMRILGIDYGTKRVGIALTDERATMAFPHEVYANNTMLLEQIVALIDQEAVGHVVIGWSKNDAGKDNPVHSHAQAFGSALHARTGLMVQYEPEQYTTQAARRLQGKHEKLDASAAALILDSYLQKQQ